MVDCYILSVDPTANMSDWSKYQCTLQLPESFIGISRFIHYYQVREYGYCGHQQSMNMVWWSTTLWIFSVASQDNIIHGGRCAAKQYYTSTSSFLIKLQFQSTLVCNQGTYLPLPTPTPCINRWCSHSEKKTPVRCLSVDEVIDKMYYDSLHVNNRPMWFCSHMQRWTSGNLGCASDICL